MSAGDRGDFGSRLREFRRRAALSQEELAERAELTAKAVSALERGERRRPYPSTVRALCDALQLDADDRALLMGAVPRPPAKATSQDDGRRGSAMRPATPMLGREDELEQLLGLLRSGANRLITVTGPGGVGKTRLAGEVLAAWGDADPAAVVVELAPVRNVDLVLPTIASCLGLQVGTGDPADSIGTLVGRSALLLVLDNLEHLIGVAPAIADLLARCEHLVVLATSRAPLRIRAEQEFPLGPLALPRRGAGARIVDESAAARMFAERARAVSPAFVIDDRNADAVAAICARLDGLPLALELAAAHVRYLSPPQLLDRLDQVVASPGPRDAPTRHQTLTATLDWSYDLLTSAERRLLGAAAVFAGGFGLDALTYVSDTETLPALNGLVEQSLVMIWTGADPAVEPRFRLLEPVRAYAAALTPDRAASGLAARHAEFYAELGMSARAGLHGPGQSRALDLLEREHANLRAALETLLSNREFARAADLGGSTWLYWALRGHAGEGIGWWDRVVDGARREGLDPDVVARAHLALAGLRLATGDIEAVAAPASAAAEAGRRLGDLRLHAEALVLAAMAATFGGRLDTAHEHLDEASAVAASLEDGWIRSHSLVARAQLRLMAGDVAGSSAALGEAERIARRDAGPFTLATVLNVQATLAQALGEADLALERSSEAARTAAEVGSTWTLVYTLPMLAAQAAERGHLELAVALFGASAATVETSLLTVVFQPDQVVAAGQLEALRTELAADDFDRAWAWGRSLGIDDVLELVPTISDPRGRA